MDEPRFLKLTIKDDHGHTSVTYVRADAIVRIDVGSNHTAEANATVELSNQDGVAVDETPEHILELLQAKVSPEIT
jgi:hypothetical protein